MAKKTVLEPSRGMVLIADRLDQKTEISGVELPDNVRSREMVWGYVISVGADCPDTEPQQLVAYGPYAGKTVVLNGVELRLMKEGQIEARTKVIDNDDPTESTGADAAL